MDIVSIYHELTVPVEQPKRQAAPPAHGKERDIGAYVAKALDLECDKLRTMAPDSGRNDQLNESAFALGTLVGAGVLDRATVEGRLYSAALECGLSESETLATLASGLDAGEQSPRDLSDVKDAARRNLGYSADLDVTGEDAQAFLDDGGEPDSEDEEGVERTPYNPWPYGEMGGRMVLCSQSKDDEEIKTYPIADFTATIAEEVIDEDGSKTFVLHGRARRGGAFELEVPAKLFGEERNLRSLLEQAAGARDPVYHRMAGHLVPAIKRLTRDDALTVTRRFRRTGWQRGEFLLPGMAKPGTRIELPSKLPYSVNPTADLNVGLAALSNLIVSIDVAATAPILAMILGAPLQRLAGWKKRYGIFVQGRTGSLKTSWVQAAMSIYGEGFLDDANLLKWGEGATRNAILQYATACHDMPFFLDNYKPQTGDGANGFVTLIHNIIEGGNRERLRRDASLMTATPIYAFPLCTGEDIPENDSASLARLLVIAFPWQDGAANPQLSRVQRDAHHLSAVGAAWLRWLAAPETKTMIRTMAAEFDACRERWSLYLRTIRTDIGNPLRVAENLAANELAWGIACQHPQIGAALRPYTTQHIDGLRKIAARMAEGTAEALEALQFLNALRELFISKQYVLLPRQLGESSDTDPNRVLGWYDDAGIYLMPQLALSTVRKLMGHGAIPVSMRTINDQLSKLGKLAVTGSERTSTVIRIGAKTVRVLHLKTEAIDGGENPSILSELGV